MDVIRVRKSEIERVYWRVAVVDIVLVAALFLNASTHQLDISVGGLTAHNIAKLKEFLLFVSATLTFWMSVLNEQVQTLKDMGLTWLEHRHGQEIARYSSLLFTLLAGELPELAATAGKYQVPTLATKVIRRFFGTLLAFWVLSLISATLAVYAAILLSVIRHPALPALLEWFVIVYAVCAYLAQVLLVLVRRLPLPYRDYSLVVELSELSQRDPEAYRRRLKELAGARGQNVKPR